MKEYRAVFLSDIHLGSSASQTGLLLQFLHSMYAHQIYLNGDIIDLWALKRRWFWPTEHNEVIRWFMKFPRRIIYIAGNHDEFLREFAGHKFGGIAIETETVHELLDGRRLLVIHGDAFDLVLQNHNWLGVLGSRAYDYLVVANKWINAIRSVFGRPYWSLAGFLKRQVKNAVNFIDNFECAATEEAGRRGLDGVVCGHIHKAEIRLIGDLIYANIGDGVDSCCCLVENMDGTLETVHWGR